MTALILGETVSRVLGRGIFGLVNVGCAYGLHTLEERLDGLRHFDELSDRRRAVAELVEATG